MGLSTAGHVLSRPLLALKIALPRVVPGPPSNRPSVVPWTHPSPHFKRHLEQFGRFCTAPAADSPCTWATNFPLKIAPSHGGSGPHVVHFSWAHLSPNLKRQLLRFSRFCTAHYHERQTDRQTDRRSDRPTANAIRRL